MIVRYITAFIAALGVTALFGLVLIPFLRRKKAGQSILEIGPSWHRKKEGTPTMGGLMFIVGIAAALFAVGYPEMLDGSSATCSSLLRAGFCRHRLPRRLPEAA